MKIPFTLLVILICRMALAQGTGYIHLNGRQFIDKSGVPFFPVVMNYHVNIVHDTPGSNPQYKIVRALDYGTDKCVLEGGYSFADCENSLADDFLQLSQMGFNTVRITGDLTPFRKPNGVFGFQKWSGIYNFGTNTGQFCGPSSRKYFDLDPPYTSTACQTYFNLIGHFLDIADQYNMKVIFLVTDGSGCGYNPQGVWTCFPDRGSSLVDAMDYAAYLTEVAKVLKNKPALLAYDLYNEPIWKVFESGRNMDKDKETVCEYTNLWYDALKSEDPNHLITLGGWDWLDVFYWDTGVMKIDFASVHIYPSQDNNSIWPVNSSIRREAIVNQFHWFTEALGKPWIIGETGFSASDITCLSSYVYGNEADQSDYLAEILPAVRDCYGSGFSWWLFQEINWYCFSDNSCNPTCQVCPKCYHTLDPKLIKENYFGLQKYSDPNPSTGLYSPSDLKAAAQITIDFDKGNGIPAIAPCEAPTLHYFDPNQFSTLNSNSSSYVTGRVEDQDGNPIKNAVIEGLNWLFTDMGGPAPGDEIPYHSWTYTFSNDSIAGNNFTIIPYTQFHPNDGRIVYIKVSAVGASKAEAGIYGSETAMNSNAGIITLNNIKFNYDAILNNITISPTSLQQNYRGWNSLSISNSTVNTGASSILVARNEVKINPSFNAEYGSDVHIYLDETFADCNDYSGFLRILNPTAIIANDNVSSIHNMIQLKFQEPITKLKIQPNPSSGKYKILIESSDDIKAMSLLVRNTLGKEIIRTTFVGNEFDIDLSSVVDGIYFLELVNDKQKINEIIIKNEIR